jgi:hypothetical protein
MWLTIVNSKVQPDPWEPSECLFQGQRGRRARRVRQEVSRERVPQGTLASQGGQDPPEPRGAKDPLDPPVSWDGCLDSLPRVRRVFREERCRREPQGGQDARDSRGRRDLKARWHPPEPQAPRATLDPQATPDPQDARELEGGQDSRERRGRGERPVPRESVSRA